MSLAWPGTGAVRHSLERGQRFVRQTVRIARWEATSGANGFDRRALLAAVALVVAIAGFGGAAAVMGTAPDDGIYRVGIAPSNEYADAIDQHARFAVVDSQPPFDGAHLDLVVRGDVVYDVRTRKERAAAAELGNAVAGHNARLMQDEPDKVAAFPVTVLLRYVERDGSALVGGSTDDGNGGGGGTSDTGAGDGDGGTTQTPTATTGGETGGGTSGGTGGGLPSFGLDLLTGTSSGTPSDIRPPFPFTSLVLAFAFVVPMNFVIQAYASSVLHERTNRRGEMLLVAPVSKWAIVAGKTLPYLVIMLVIAGLTSLVLGGGLVSLGAVAPVALLFLACAFVGALLARSHKELTFVLVTVSVTVTTYVFVPAIFADVHPIAAISPLTVVVRQLQGVGVGAGTFAFATGPMALASGVLFLLGAGLYREEDLFAQLPVPAKVLDALAGPIRSVWSAGLLSLLLLPFVILAELLAVAVLFVLPVSVSLPVLLVVIAAIEEVGKSLHVYAGFARGKYDPSLRTALAAGAASGAGFFLGEKLAVIAQVVGLDQLDLGRAAFQLTAGVGGSTSPLVLLGLLLAPLGLHVLTAATSAVGAREGRLPYFIGLTIAVVVHAIYNLGVIGLVG